MTKKKPTKKKPVKPIASKSNAWGMQFYFGPKMYSWLFSFGGKK